MDKEDIKILIEDIKLDWKTSRCKFNTADNKVKIDLAIIEQNACEEKLKVLYRELRELEE